MIKKVLLVSTVLLMSGCGGSSDSDTSTDTNTDNTSESTGGSVDATLVSGLYNNSTRDPDSGVVTDESYTYISTTGLISVYDYQGDGSGTGGNCYSSPSDVSKTNWSIDNVQIGAVFDIDGGKAYELELREGNGSLPLTFNYTEARGMHTFNLANFVHAGTGISMSSSINGTDINLNLGGEGNMKVSGAPTIEEIRSMPCN